MERIFLTGNTKKLSRSTKRDRRWEILKSQYQNPQIPFVKTQVHWNWSGRLVFTRATFLDRSYSQELFIFTGANIQLRSC
jgi:hypothetical protein